LSPDALVSFILANFPVHSFVLGSDFEESAFNLFIFFSAQLIFALPLNHRNPLLIFIHFHHLEIPILLIIIITIVIIIDLFFGQVNLRSSLNF